MSTTFVNGTEVGPDGKEWAKTEAGYAFVESVVPLSWTALHPALVWSGYVVRDAFVAGAEWQEKRQAWVQTSDRRPDAGRYIVKRWKNGSVWAGVYSGTDKDSSFDEWCYLPNN